MKIYSDKKHNQFVKIKAGQPIRVGNVVCRGEAYIDLLKEIFEFIRGKSRKGKAYNAISFSPKLLGVVKKYNKKTKTAVVQLSGSAFINMGDKS